MRTGTVLAALLLLAACGTAAPQTGSQPSPDSPAAIADNTTTTTAVVVPGHVIDYTLRNPFERP